LGIHPDMREFLRRNGLSLVLASCFLTFWGAQSITGWLNHNNEERDHGQPAISYFEYLSTGSFLEATAENWESEFLQMFFYVWFTTFLYQKGSAESKWPEDEAKEPETEYPEEEQPGPVRRGGWQLRLYEHSLSLTFAALFLISFIAHALGGAREYSADQVEHGQQAVSTLQYLGTSRFWFESFQNWQSEFLAVLAMVVLSIWSREKDSPESKEVDAPHWVTGS
jgi:hypothetical protein